MKKILYSLLIFVSIFFVFDKVSASTNTYDVGFKTINGWLEEAFSREIPSNLTANFTAIENGILLEYGEYYFCSSYETWSLTNCYVTDNLENFVSYFHVSGIYINTYPQYSKMYEVNLRSGAVESVADRYSGYNGTAIGGSYSLYRQITNVSYFKFYRQSDLTDSTSIVKTSDGFTFNRGDVLIYNDNGTFILNTEYKTVDDLFKEPEPYIFDEYIEDYNYSKMIFDFDLSILEERENIFDLLLNDFYVSNDIRNSILYEVEPFEIGYPYFEYTTSSGFKGISYLKDLDGNDITSKKKMYTGKYLDTLPADTVSLKFIIPLLDTVEYQLKVSLVTFYPFTVSYETYEQEYSYRETIELPGKYGVIFMPKLVENNSDIMTSFETWGIEKVLVYDTYDYKQAPIEVYSDDITTFDYTFKYQYINYNLFFINDINSSYSAIEYDTRYFDYQIVDTKYSIGTIVNPNTGESNYIDFSNTSNIVSNFDSLSGVFEFISEQLDKNNSAYLLFYDSVNVFFNTMPVDVYVLILTVFSIILLGVTLALGGWK